jgi:hypothetical protein
MIIRKNILIPNCNTMALLNQPPIRWVKSGRGFKRYSSCIRVQKINYAINYYLFILNSNWLYSFYFSVRLHNK